MLEEDYLKYNAVGEGLASSHKQDTNKSYEFNDPRAKELNKYSTQLIRELIIPKLTKEVNSSKRYAALRQVYYSLILSRWFKMRFSGKQGTYASLINSGNLTNLTSQQAWSKATYFKQYQKSFSEGEYNIKEPVSTPTGQVIRSYFSGGIQMTSSAIGVDRFVVGKEIPAVLLNRQGTIVLMQGNAQEGVSSGINNELIGLFPVSSKTSSAINQVSSSVSYATLDDVEVDGKTVLARVDMNVPAEDGHIKDIENPHKRVIESAKTIKELAEEGAKVVVIFHQGRPKDKEGNEDPNFMEHPFDHAQQLEKLVGNHNIIAVDDLFGPKALDAIDNLKSGEILLLKPVRAVDPSTGETIEKDPLFVGNLKSRIQLFVNDAFSVSHRETPSVTGFKGIPTIAGRLMQKELEEAAKSFNPPHPHLVVVGGGKVQEKYIEMSESLKSGRADKVVVGGRLANLALVACQYNALNYDVLKHNTPDEIYDLATTTVGKATADNLKGDDGLKLVPELAKLISDYRDKIELPVDMVYLDSSGCRYKVDLFFGCVPPEFNQLLSGIGPNTAKAYAEIAGRKENPFKSAFILGPLSDSRFPVLFNETRQVLQAVAGNRKYWTTGGGDTEKLVTEQLRFEPTYSSLAGGALAEFKAGKILPGVQLLYDNHPKTISLELIEGLVRRFDQRLKQGNAAVVDEIKEYNSKLRVDERQLVYEWLQHHESVLAAGALAGIGFNWGGIVQELKGKIEGKIDANPRAAARQLEEIAVEGTYAGLVVPDDVRSQAERVWKENSQFKKLTKYLLLPKMPELSAKQAGVLMLVRHGETSWSEAKFNKMAGWHDAKITEKGRNGAREAFERINVGLIFHRAFTSTLLRSIDTLEEGLIAIGQTNVPVKHEKALRERNYGNMMGWNRRYAKEEFGDNFLNWRRGFAGNAMRPPGAENLMDVQLDRALPYFISEIMPAIARGENVVISAHGNSLRAIVVFLRECALGRKLTEDEIKGIEIQLTVPIVYVFDDDLRGNKNLWVDESKRPSDVKIFLEQANVKLNGNMVSSSVFSPGGIDFGGRAMNIKYEAGGSFKGMDLKLPNLSLSELESINIDSEIQRIKKMVSSGISPSGDWVMKIVSACKQKGKLGYYSSDLLLCFVDACELGEINGDKSSADFKKALAVVDLLS
ncbi:MAG: phosphoglycerate kinase [Candidatus Omnitrophota bacterium]